MLWMLDGEAFCIKINFRYFLRTYYYVLEVIARSSVYFHISASLTSKWLCKLTSAIVKYFCVLPKSSLCLCMYGVCALFFDDSCLMLHRVFSAMRTRFFSFYEYSYVSTFAISHFTFEQEYLL